MNELTALALERAGFSDLAAFRDSLGIPAEDEEALDAALEPWLLGYREVTIRKGDTFWLLAQAYDTTTEAIAQANPNLDPLRLPIGGKLQIPLPFRIVPTDVPMTSQLCTLCLQGIASRYPTARLEQLTSSATGKPIWTLTVGSGRRRVLYTAAHHANEWITATLVLKFAEDYAKAMAEGGQIEGMDARELAQNTTAVFVPMVNPDGVDLVTGVLDTDGDEYRYAQALAASYPGIPFPDGWKSNLLGVDLNLNYPAGWDTAKEIKFSQGYTRPGPRDFVGNVPFSQRETRALAQLTRRVDPQLVLAFHSQGQVIYWQFQDIFVPGAEELGTRFADASGYTLADTPYDSSFAGYKDWFIQEFRRPGYTVEVGAGENPLPLSQFAQIYKDNSKIMAIGLEG